MNGLIAMEMAPRVSEKTGKTEMRAARLLSMSSKWLLEITLFHLAGARVGDPRDVRVTRLSCRGEIFPPSLFDRVRMVDGKRRIYFSPFDPETRELEGKLPDQAPSDAVSAVSFVPSAIYLYPAASSRLVRQRECRGSDVISFACFSN